MKVEMLNVGWMTTVAGMWREGEEDPERRARFPIPAYLIETETERILIDAGLHPDAAANAGNRYGAGPLDLFELEQEESIAEQIDLGTLTRLVLTHLHFDHVGGLSLVPASTPVYLQRVEWQAGRERAAVERNFFQPRDYAVEPPNLTLLDGDHDLLGDGSIELLATPGHTPGHQSVRLGDLVLGADVIHYAQTLDDHRFPLFADSHEDQRHSAERLCALRESGARIQPGHDPDLLRPGVLST